MPTTPQITVGLVRSLLNSPASDPVLHLDDGVLAVSSEAHVRPRTIVATREEASEYFGEHHVDGLPDETIEELLPGTERWVENTIEALAY